jgi:aerobic carbon-monoxide dehydrogenase large subunit
MNDQTPTSAERAERLQGTGCKRKRVEDIRFVQGKGNYVDDLKLPGMLYGDFTRSPHAHARVNKIDTAKAKAVPGVLAVLTAADLKPLNLHYMPTLAGDVAAVLAEEKVLYQNQEVAFVIAEDRYVAADAADLVEVEYEALPVVIDPFKAMAPDAPLLRGAEGLSVRRLQEALDVLLQQQAVGHELLCCLFDQCGAVARIRVALGKRGTRVA